MCLASKSEEKKNNKETIPYLEDGGRKYMDLKAILGFNS